MTTFKKNDKTGQMYPWIDCMHTHLRGSCPHECVYCYAKKMRCAKFYMGPLTLKEEELEQNYYKYGEGVTIFVEHMSDLFADGVPEKWIGRIIEHCKAFDRNRYVFQTKNPGRMWIFIDEDFPSNVLLGTTVETDDERLLKIYSKAPNPQQRCGWLSVIKEQNHHPTFITIEPVMKFNPHVLGSLICSAQPDFVNIGADSKRCNLPEPTAKELNTLIDIIKSAGIEIREKHNLGRLLAEKKNIGI